RQTACKPGSVHRVAATVWPFLWDVRYRTPHATYPDDDPETDHVPSLFGLAPGGVCRAVCVATSAVRSYRTVSPLPRLTPIGGLLSVALSLGFPPADVIRHRVSVEPGLSSKPACANPAAIRPSDAGGFYDIARACARRLASLSAHSISHSPSSFFGRNRRWKATTTSFAGQDR